MQRLHLLFHAHRAAQCLVHAPELAAIAVRRRSDTLINPAAKFGSRGDFTRALTQTIAGQWQSTSKFTWPTTLKQAIANHWPDAAGSVQQDAGELLAKLFGCLEDDTAWPMARAQGNGSAGGSSDDNNPKPDDPGAKAREALVPFDPLLLEAQPHTEGYQAAVKAWVQHCKKDGSVPNRLVGGMLQDELTCPDCGNRSRTFQSFNVLTLPVPAVHRTYSVTLVGEIDVPRAVAKHWLQQSGVDRGILQGICQTLSKYPGVRPLLRGVTAGTESPRAALQSIAAMPVHRAARLPSVTLVSLRVDTFAHMRELLACLRRRVGLPAREVELYAYQPPGARNRGFRGLLDSDAVDLAMDRGPIIVQASANPNAALSGRGLPAVDAGGRSGKAMGGAAAAAAGADYARAAGNGSQGLYPCTGGLPGQHSWIPIRHRVRVMRRREAMLRQVEYAGHCEGQPLYGEKQFKTGMPYMARVTAFTTEMELLAVAHAWDERCRTVRPPARHAQAPKERGPAAPVTPVDVVVEMSPVRPESAGWAGRNHPRPQEEDGVAGIEEAVRAAAGHEGRQARAGATPSPGLRKLGTAMPISSFRSRI